MKKRSQKTQQTRQQTEPEWDYLTEIQEAAIKTSRPLHITHRTDAGQSQKDKIKEIIEFQNSILSIKTKVPNGEKRTYSLSPDRNQRKSDKLLHNVFLTDANDDPKPKPFLKNSADFLSEEKQNILKNIRSDLKTSMRDKLQFIQKIEQVVGDPTIDLHAKKDLIYNMHIHSKYLLPQQASYYKFLKEKKRLSKYTGAKIILDSFDRNKKNSSQISRSQLESEMSNQLKEPGKYPEKKFADYYQEFLKRQSPNAVVRLRKNKRQLSPQDLLSGEESHQELETKKLKGSSSLPSLFPKKNQSYSPEKNSSLRSYENYLPDPKVIKVNSLLRESQTERRLRPKITKPQNQPSARSSFRLDTSRSESGNFISKHQNYASRSSSDQTRKNYLPVLKEYLQKSKIKKQNCEGILKRDLTKTEKCELLKSNIEIIEQKVKMAQLKVKYMKSSHDVEEAQNSIDQYYVDSIKSKLAIINQLAS